VLTFKENKQNYSAAQINRVKTAYQKTVDKFNAQHEPIEVIEFAKLHDRFMIIDEKVVYHIGASLKDLGKKWFAFSKMEINPKEILGRLHQNKV
jgi:hypothetical protein